MDSYAARWRMRIGLGVMAVAFAGPALAEDWWTIYADKNPLELTIMLVDAASLKPDTSETNAVRFQEMLLLDGVHVVTDSVVRCDTKQNAVIATTTYFNDGRPNPIKLKTSPGWKTLRTEGDLVLYDFVCPPQRRDGRLMRHLGEGVDRLAVVKGLEQAHRQALPQIRQVMAEKNKQARMNQDMDELDKLLGNTPAAPADAKGAKP